VFRSEIPTSEKMPSPSNPSYWIQKKAHRATGYPVASIAYYGPDDTFASKVVAAIILSEKDDEVASIEKWFSESLDVRRDPVIMNQILQFIERHKVVRVAMMDRIIGCPHEEGIDYPLGEKCPQCPFWANRDRWTGKIIE
jgi:hypothetical protein